MDHDPYFAGRPPDKTANEPNPMIVVWVAVYSSNLLVPLFISSFVTDKAGKFGMTIAIFLVLGLGCLVVPRHRHAGKAVITGGCFTAVFQFLPALPLFAGTIGVAVARNMGQTIGHEQIASEFGGFVATVVTGGILITMALTMGAMVVGISAWFEGSRAKGQQAKKAGDLDVLWTPPALPDGLTCPDPRDLGGHPFLPLRERRQLRHRADSGRPGETAILPIHENFRITMPDLEVDFPFREN